MTRGSHHQRISVTQAGGSRTKLRPKHGRGHNVPLPNKGRKKSRRSGSQDR